MKMPGSPRDFWLAEDLYNVLTHHSDDFISWCNLSNSNSNTVLRIKLVKLQWHLLCCSSKQRCYVVAWLVVSYSDWARWFHHSQRDVRSRSLLSQLSGMLLQFSQTLQRQGELMKESIMQTLICGIKAMAWNTFCFQVWLSVQNMLMI